MGSVRTVVVLGVVLSLALAGCIGTGNDGNEVGDEISPDVGATMDVDDAVDAESAVDDVDSVYTAEARTDEETNDRMADRQLIHTGEIELIVEDAAEQGGEVRTLATDRGGFVSGASQEVHERHNETWRTETIEVRVPNDAFDRTMTDLAAIGTVQSSETTTQDVTDQLVDLDARLTNLHAERDRLRTLYEDAEDTQDVLAVQRELSDVQEEIERLSARQAALEEDVAYSTITVYLTEDEPEPEPLVEEPPWYETSIVSAFLHSTSGVFVTLRAIGVGMAFAAPYVLVFGSPIVGGLGVYWYRRRV